MKKLFFIACAVTLLTACEKPIIDDEVNGNDGTSGTITLPTGETVNAKKFTFTLKGDFTSEWKPVNKVQRRTAGYLAADGKDMTDVWVLDYMNGNLVQQVHQDDNTAEDFGKPVMNLAYGSHHVYFIAGRGTGAVLDTDNHTITFAKSLDTFYKDYEVSVVATSNGNRAVTLDRIVTRLKLIFTDAIPADAATINITPHTWYYAWDYVNGTPAGAATDQVVTLNIPDSEKGKTDVFASLFGFSTTTEWTTDIAINSKKADNTVIGSATLTSVPFKANRSTDFTGPLFGSEGLLTMTLNTTWDDSYTGTW